LPNPLGPIHDVGSYISGYLRCLDRISDDEQPAGKEVALMPTTHSTTIRDIYDRVPDSVNLQLIMSFHQFMKDSGTSPRHQNNNLKAIISFAVFLGPGVTFYEVNSKDQINCFLDTKRKPDCVISFTLVSER
jgi:hypothetical protein